MIVGAEKQFAGQQDSEKVKGEKIISNKTEKANYRQVLEKEDGKIWCRK